MASDFLPERSFSFVEPFAFCDSLPATAAGQGRAFTLLVLLGGSGGTADAGLLTVTYVFQKMRFFEYGTASAISVSLLPLMLLLLWGCLFLRRRTA